jgi:hypothetical protein
MKNNFKKTNLNITTEKDRPKINNGRLKTNYTGNRKNYSKKTRVGI